MKCRDSLVNVIKTCCLHDDYGYDYCCRCGEMSDESKSRLIGQDAL